jgi:hypothetical protein
MARHGGGKNVSHSSEIEAAFFCVIAAIVLFGLACIALGAWSERKRRRSRFALLDRMRRSNVIDLKDHSSAARWNRMMRR